MRPLLQNAIVSFVLVCLLGTNPASAQSYTITRLDPSHPGLYNFSSGTNINNKGVVIGSGSGIYTTDVITVWQPNQTIGTPVYYYGYNRTTPEGINDSGQILGHGPDNSNPSQPHGRFNGIDLGVGYTNDVNNLGQVVGWTFDSLYIWKDGIFDFQPTSYWGSEILSINDYGVGAGYWFTDCSNDCFTEVCIFQGDSIVLLGRLSGNEAQGNDINNLGQITGWGCLDVDCSQSVGFLWTEGNYLIIPTLGGNSSDGNAINDSGVVVGQAYNSSNQQRAIIFDAVNGLRDLNDLIPAGSGWELLTASDINNRGQITGVGKIGGLTRAFLLSPPDTSIEIVSPELNQLFIAGEKDTIRWYAENIEFVKISAILHYNSVFDQIEIPIVDSIPASDETYVWEIPDSLLSRQCRIVIQDVENPAEADTSSDFRIKGYVLTRITEEGEYEAFRSDVHGWWNGNNTQSWWPPNWWLQFDYDGDAIDPYTNARYPASFVQETHATADEFIDWPLFVKTFGADTCYTREFPTSNDYRPSAMTFWAIKNGYHQGSCVGLAATSIVAFGNKDLLLQRFPEFGDFDDLYTAALTDARREVVNQLMFTQYAVLPQMNEDTVLRNPNEAWIQRVKSIFLDEDRSHDVFLGLYSSRGGGHAVTPYKLVKDSVPGISGETYFLYVYDNNHPGDTTRAFLIRPSDGFWRYPPTGPAPWLAYGTGLILEPFSLYMVNAELASLAREMKTPETRVTGAEDYQRVYGFSDASVVIRGGGGDSIGFVDTVVFNTLSGAEPIMVKSGFLSRPIGYKYPQQDVEILVSNFTDSIFDFYATNESISTLYNIYRAGTTPSDSDRFYVRNGVSFWNEGASDKPLSLSAIQSEPGQEKVYSVHKFDLNSSDSAYIEASSDVLYLVNVGPQEVYDLTLRIASNSGGEEVEVKDIPFNANSGHLIWPNWNDLSAPIRIEIDLNNDGPVDDTMYVNAIPTDITGPLESGLPTEFELLQNYPNPFNPVTTIEYQIPSRSKVTIEIFNVLGQKVRTLVDEIKAAGSYRIEWNSKDDYGKPVSSGVYLYLFRAGNVVQAKKMLLLK